jgi:hypothetical protein
MTYPTFIGEISEAGKKVITSPNTETIKTFLDITASAPSNVLNEGYDVFLIAGQSNAQGWGTGIDTTVDFSDPRILQYPGSGTNQRTLRLATEPLVHRATEANKIGFGLDFARNYVRVTNRNVILVPCASPGTGFQDNRWNPGNDLFNYAVENTLLVLALDSKNKLKGILWHQGEQDVGTADSLYQTRLDAMINAFRSQLNQPTVPFICAGMVPGWVAGDAGRQAIQAVIAATPTRISNTAYVDPTGLAGISGDIIHFSNISQRLLGDRYFAAYITRFYATAVPERIYNLTSNILSNRIILSWQSSGTTWRVTANNQTLTVTSPNIQLNNLSPLTAYPIRIIAINSLGESLPFDITLTTIAAPVSTIPQATFEMLFEGNFNNTGSGGVVPQNNGVTIINDAVRGQVGRFATNTSDKRYILTNHIITAEYTKAAWVRYTNVGNNWSNVLSNLADAPRNAFGMRDNNRFVSGYEPGSYINVSDASDFPRNTWVHMAVTQSATQLKLFKNGVLIATNTVTFAGGSNIFLGNLSATGENWIGEIDKAQMWNTALSDAQILELYEQG